MTCNLIFICLFLFFFFFKQKTAYEMRISDWSSDVCSSDLGAVGGGALDAVRERAGSTSRPEAVVGGEPRAEPRQGAVGGAVARAGRCRLVAEADHLDRKSVV